MTEDDDPATPGDQGLSIGVVRAWEYLHHTGLPPQDGVWEPARIALIDNAFDVDPATGEGDRDFLFNPPPQVDLADFDGTADGPASGFAPWHGQGVFGVCCAFPRNLFGGAGRGGEYVRPIAIKTPLGFADIASSVRTAWLMQADVINLSLGAQCNWLCDVGDFFVESHLQEEIVTATVMGSTVLASAGNGPDNMTTDFDIADGDWIPCEMSRVTCVGAIGQAGSNIWNWGSGVDIWAPTNTLATVDPITQAFDPDDVGRDELKIFGGTSSASPSVAGIAGLLKTAVPGMPWNEVQQVLIDTANPSSDFRVSTGYVDALRAVQAVRPNPPPTVRFLFLDDGDTLSWARRGLFDFLADDPVDPRGFVGRVDLDSDVEGFVCAVEGDSNVPSCEGRLRILGDHVLTATATDEFGAFGQASVEVEVTNSPPQLTLLAPQDGSTHFSDQGVSMRAGVVDFDGEDFDRPCPAGFEEACVEWSSDRDGDLTPSTAGEGVLDFAQSLTPGTHVLTVRAIDGKGAMDEESAMVTILEGVGVPTARILTSARTAGADQVTVLEGVGTDPEDGTLDPATYEWTSSVDGFLGTGSPLPVVLSDAGCETIVEHTITLTVTDGDGNSDTDTIVIQVIVIC